MAAETSPSAEKDRIAYTWTPNDQADHEAGHPSGYDCDGYAIMPPHEVCGQVFPPDVPRDRPPANYAEARALLDDSLLGIPPFPPEKTGA